MNNFAFNFKTFRLGIQIVININIYLIFEILINTSNKAKCIENYTMDAYKNIQGAF